MIIGPFEHTLYYYGLAADAKPGEDQHVRLGSRLIETDTGDEFVYGAAGTWTEIKQNVLTTAEV